MRDSEKKSEVKTCIRVKHNVLLFLQFFKFNFTKNRVEFVERVTVYSHQKLSELQLMGVY